MTEHIYNYMYLNAHKPLTDKIDLIYVADNFVSANERRLKFFGKF